MGSTKSNWLDFGRCLSNQGLQTKCCIQIRDAHRLFASKETQSKPERISIALN